MKSRNIQMFYSFLLLGSVIVLSILIFNFIRYDTRENKDYNILNKKNTEFFIAGPGPARSGNIFIDNNWTEAKAAGICTGNGTFSEPYIIQDFVIKGGGSYWSCILIENSNVFFRIENCTLYNIEGVSYAINLVNVQNGVIINNNCSTKRTGIYIYYSSNVTISGNLINNIGYQDGILLEHSNNNTVLGNSLNNCGRDGIHIEYSKYNIIIENEMNACGLGLEGTIEDLRSHNIDTTNKVNGKPLFYYFDEIMLGLDNFTNAGQVILINCNQSLISHLNTTNCSIGISLYYCNNNNITENNANYNNVCGINIENSDHNWIHGNNVNYNYNPYDYNYNGISLKWSHYNNITENIATNDYSGVSLYYSDFNIVSKNIVENNLHGIFSSFSDYNYILYNNLTFNRDGIDVRDSNYNQIEGNIATNEHYKGIYLSRGNHNTIKGNTVINNSNGIELFSNSYNVISENIVNNNSYAGINLWHFSCYNTVSRNSINNNSNYGIHLYSQSNNNYLFGNTLIGNPVCINEEDCLGNLFWDNGMCLYVGKRSLDILIYFGLGFLVITSLILLEKKRSIFHKF